MRLQLALGLVMCVFSVACQKSSDGVPAGDQKPVYTGDLEKLYHDLQTNEDYAQSDLCDRPYYAQQMEIVSELEKRKSEIEELQAKRTKEQASVEKKYLGQLTLVVRPKVETEKGYKQSEAWGWKDIISFYSEIKGQPTNEKWLQLNREVRDIAPDDQDRIQHWVNLEVQRTDEQFLIELLSFLNACKADTACSSLPEALATRVEGNQLHRWYNTYWKKNPDKKDYILGRFITRVTNDYSNRFKMFDAGNEVDLGSQTINVKINASAVGAEAKSLETYLLKPWQEAGVNVKIEWLMNRLEKAFDLILAPSGGRAFVSLSDDLSEKQLSLPKISWTSTLTHEFGHILSLRDEYYTIWNSSTCKYHIEYDDSNIMSRSSTGSILPRHVEAIKNFYFPKRPQE